MTILGMFGKGKGTTVLPAQAVVALTGADAFAASLPAQTTPQDRWSWLEANYPQTYAVFTEVAEVRPDMKLEIVESDTIYGPSTTFILGDGDFQTQMDRRRSESPDSLKGPWPMKVATISKPEMRINEAASGYGYFSDATAADALRKYAINEGFVVVEQKPGPSGSMKKVLAAGPAKFEQPNPAGSPNPGRPKLTLVT